MSTYAASVLPEEILHQRANGWPDFHPEDFCHRCGRRNPVWWVDANQWETATEDRPRGELDILCPSCFVELHEAATGQRFLWELRITPTADAETAAGSRERAGGGRTGGGTREGAGTA